MKKNFFMLLACIVFGIVIATPISALDFSWSVSATIIQGASCLYSGCGRHVHSNSAVSYASCASGSLSIITCYCSDCSDSYTVGCAPTKGSNYCKCTDGDGDITAYVGGTCTIFIKTEWSTPSAISISDEAKDLGSLASLGVTGTVTSVSTNSAKTKIWVGGATDYSKQSTTNLADHLYVCEDSNQNTQCDFLECSQDKGCGYSSFGFCGNDSAGKWKWALPENTGQIIDFTGCGGGIWMVSDGTKFFRCGDFSINNPINFQAVTDVSFGSAACGEYEYSGSKTLNSVTYSLCTQKKVVAQDTEILADVVAGWFECPIGYESRWSDGANYICMKKGSLADLTIVTDVLLASYPCPAGYSNRGALHMGAFSSTYPYICIKTFTKPNAFTITTISTPGKTHEFACDITSNAIKECNGTDTAISSIGAVLTGIKANVSGTTHYCGSNARWMTDLDALVPVAITNVSNYCDLSTHCMFGCSPRRVSCQACCPSGYTRIDDSYAVLGYTVAPAFTYVLDNVARDGCITYTWNTSGGGSSPRFTVNVTAQCNLISIFAGTGALDPDFQVKNQTCSAATNPSLTWTGTKCCSEAEDNPNSAGGYEYYNDAGGTGGCWNSNYIASGKGVNKTTGQKLPGGQDIFGKDNVIANINGTFYGCNITQTVSGFTFAKMDSCESKYDPATHTTITCWSDGKWRSGGGVFLRSIGWDLPRADDTPSNCCAEDQCWNGRECVERDTIEIVRDKGYLCAGKEGYA